MKDYISLFHFVFLQFLFWKKYRCVESWRTKSHIIIIHTNKEDLSYYLYVMLYFLEFLHHNKLFHYQMHFHLLDYDSSTSLFSKLMKNSSKIYRYLLYNIYPKAANEQYIHTQTCVLTVLRSWQLWSCSAGRNFHIINKIQSV